MEIIFDLKKDIEKYLEKVFDGEQRGKNRHLDYYAKAEKTIPQVSIQLKVRI